MTNKLTRNGENRVVKGTGRVIGVEKSEKCGCVGELRVKSLIDRKFKFYNFALGEYQPKIVTGESIYDDFRLEGIADLKEILDRNSGEALVERFGIEWDKYTAQAKEAADPESIVLISDENYAAMQKATANVADEWVASAPARIKPNELLEAAKQLLN